jgi:hypothetical protein
MATNPVFAVSDCPDCDEPLIETERGIFKDSPDLRTELLSTGFALHHAAAFNLTDVITATTRAGWSITVPFDFPHEVLANVKVSEISNGLQQCLGSFSHRSHPPVFYSPNNFVIVQSVFDFRNCKIMSEIMVDFPFNLYVFIQENRVVFSCNHKGFPWSENAETTGQAWHSIVIRWMILDARCSDPVPYLTRRPIMQRKPFNNKPFPITGWPIYPDRFSFRPGRAFLSPHPQAIQNPASTLFYVSLFYQSSQKRPDWASLVVAGAISRFTRRPHAPGSDMIEEVILRPFNDLKSDTVVTGLILCELTSSVPFNPTEVGMDDNNPVQYLGFCCQIADDVKHGLAILARRTVDDNPIKFVDRWLIHNSIIT